MSPKKKKKGKKSVEFEEEVLWTSDSEEDPEVEGISIYLPEELSKISRFKVQSGHEECGYSDFIAIYDKNDDLLIAAVDNFFSEPLINQVADMAKGRANQSVVKWSWADIHRNLQPHLAHDLSKGIRFELFPSEFPNLTQNIAPELIFCSLLSSNPFVPMFSCDSLLFRIRFLAVSLGCAQTCTTT